MKINRKFSFLRRRLFWTCFLVLSTSSCFLTRKQNDPKATRLENTAYFVSVPIFKFSSTQAPCLQVQIDDKTFSMELDLGLRGDLSITRPFIDQILSKTFISTQPMYGFKGKEYPTNLYQIPKIKIGAMVFIQPTLQENTEQSRKDSVIVQNGETPSPREPGRIGWELFHNVNLLLDIKNSKIAFCDSLSTLEDQGYKITDFIKVPLLLERGLVEFETDIPNGHLRCVLDTGATWNILNTKIEEEKPLEQIIQDPSNILEYSSFQIGAKEFGPVPFHRIPIKLPIHIEAILGMEFIEDHLIFLDFAEKYVYFSKTSPTR